MNIVFITPECYPYTSASNLGDFVFSLARGIEQAGNNVKILLPRYGSIDPQHTLIERLPNEFKIQKNLNALIYKGILKESLVSTFLIDNQNFFSNSKEVYLGHEKDFDRFDFFCNAAISLINDLSFSTDIVHLFSPYSSFCVDYFDLYEECFEDTKIIFNVFNSSGISNEFLLKTKRMIDKANVICMFSEKCLTNENLVDKNIQKMLLNKKDKVFSIFPGLDDKEYDPETDSLLKHNFSKNYFSIGKKKSKEELIQLCNFESEENIPIFSYIGSLNRNDCIMSLLSSLPYLLSNKINFILCGKGDHEIEIEFKKLGVKNKNFQFLNSFDNETLKAVYAGSDFMLCQNSCKGNELAILLAMRYGCIPIVSSESIFIDKLVDISQDDGFIILIKELGKDEFYKSFDKALSIFKNKQALPKIIKNAMHFNSRMDNCTEQYIELYNKVLNSVLL